MTYEKFLDTMKDNLQSKFKESMQVKIHKILKNNHIQLEGLAFHNLHNEVSPTIYLNDYFVQYEEGRPLEEITEEIYSIYQNNKDALHFEVDFFKNFSNISHRIVYKIIDYNSNLKLLANVPHKRFLDLAIVYYLILDKNTSGNMTTLVQNQHLDFWNVDIDTIHQLSDLNTPEILPYSLRNMEHVLQEILLEDFINENHIPLSDETEDIDTSTPMYVLTNDIGINGAACMLYDNVLKETAKKLGSDIIILPSSIHEVLLIPKDEEINIKDFADMVSDINETQVQPEDRLSNQVYLYSLKTNSITLAF